MDGSVTDIIQTVSNSVVQGFPEYHGGSCARLNALPNSRVERGHHVRGETKRSNTGSLCKVRLPAEKMRPFSQQESVEVHDETWAGGQEILRLSISQSQEIQPRCAVSVFPLWTSFLTPELPGPGSEIRARMGWMEVEENRKVGGCGGFRVPSGDRIFSCSLCCSGLGEERVVPHSVVAPSASSCSCSYAYGRDTAIGPHTGAR